LTNCSNVRGSAPPIKRELTLSISGGQGVSATRSTGGRCRKATTERHATVQRRSRLRFARRITPWAACIRRELSWPPS
jgi:hypothetical protein